MAERYIEQRGDRFRVRVSRRLGRKTIGTFSTREQATEARDVFLSKIPPIDSPPNLSQPPTIPTPRQAWNAKPLKLDLAPIWIYASDVHAPAYSKLAIERLIAVAQYYEVPRLVLGGDTLDWSSVSNHPNVVPQHTVSETQEATGELLSILGSVFKEIIVFSGNHDVRIAKKLGSHIPLETLLYGCIKSRPFKAELVVSDFEFAYFGDEGDGGPNTGIVAGHPRFYGSTPAKMLTDVAMIQHRHVLGSHNHLCGQMWSRCGRYWAIDPGCLADATNTPYLQVGAGISKYPIWRNGFVLMRRNMPLVMTDGWTDWGTF